MPDAASAISNPQQSNDEPARMRPSVSALVVSYSNRSSAELLGSAVWSEIRLQPGGRDAGNCLRRAGSPNAAFPLHDRFLELDDEVLPGRFAEVGFRPNIDGARPPPTGAAFSRASGAAAGTLLRDRAAPRSRW